MHNSRHNHHKRPSNYYSGNFPNNNTQQKRTLNRDHVPEQGHVHEIQGSVEIAEPHNHRFSTVSGEAIGVGLNHYHKVSFRTDYFEGHYHEYHGRTTGAIPVGDRHVHFIKSYTTVSDNHRHNFRAATQIENPIGEEWE